MTNIVEVFELEGTHVSKIYRFAGNNIDSTTSSKSDVPVKVIDQYIHHDDSISTIKYKIFNALDSKVSVEEMYLFYHNNTYLHPRQVYTILTQDEEFPLEGASICSFMKNIHKRISCDSEKEDYEYDFILDNIDPNTRVKVDTSIGTKCLLKKKYPFIVNPFNCNITDSKIAEDDYNIVQTTNSNLLFQYPNVKRIYLCKATSVLINAQVAQDYLIKLYYPLLYKKRILSSEVLQEKQPELLEKNVKEIQKNVAQLLSIQEAMDSVKK